MCGIVAYIGEQNATPIIVNGLKKLEYRGYDSAGVAVLQDNRIGGAAGRWQIARLEA
jgi:glutamine--fructose-6-phosphate transaminase (EC 2.6.1.16)